MSDRHSQRVAYGEALVSLGEQRRDVVVMEADLGKSTMSNMFQQAYPERYFEMGIAEQNMISTAAGLAASGKTVFCSTFAVFASGRPYDQIRQTVAIGKLNVKICGSSSGMSDFGDGATHQAIEDIAIMSAIPNMTVLTPCDAAEVKRAVVLAAELEGPVYIRVVRNPVLDYTNEMASLELGKPQVLCKGDDVLLLAHGVMVEKAMEAAEMLKKSGVSASVANISTMKPFNYDEIARMAEATRAVVTAEDHSYIGGLASAVALALRQSAVPMDYVAIEDTFGQSACSSQELMDHYGLTSAAIISKTLSLLNNCHS